MEGIFTRELIVSKKLCKFLGVTVFIILTALGAFVRVPLPFTPVPLTLQTFFVLLSGAFLGGRPGALSQMGYVFLGVAGISVFTSSGSGLLYLSGPTGGYLAGFIAASFLAGRLLSRARGSFPAVFFVFCAADAVLLCVGALWMRFSLSLSFSQAFFIGVLPFIPGDILKAFFAAALYMKLSRRMKEIFGS